MRTASVIFVAAALDVSAAPIFYHIHVRPTPVFVPPRIVSIDKGESMATAARRLSHSGVIANSLAFILYAELTGQARRVKPGDYGFKGGEGIPEVLRHLVNGDFMAVTVIIPEGMTVHQIGERLQAAGLVCDSMFDRAAFDGRLSQALGLGALGVEGFLFPATYRFSPLATSDQLLAAMLERFYSVLTPQVEERMFELEMNARQLVTMASIIEKEARVPGERPIIASVFYNRLALGMPLQSDPTAQYNYAGEVEPARAERLAGDGSEAAPGEHALLQHHQQAGDDHQQDRHRGGGAVERRRPRRQIEDIGGEHGAVGRRAEHRRNAVDAEHHDE